jgi:uncharacterized protein YqhQ
MASSAPVLSTVLKWASVLVILYCALTFDEPLMSRYRTIATLFIPVLVIFLIIRVYRDIKVCRGPFLARWERILLIWVLVWAILALSHQIAVFQYYHAMYEMIRAYHKGELDQTALNHSNQRLLAFAPLLR